MTSYALNVLHHRDRIGEDRRIDALQDDPLFPFTVIKRRAIRIVNMPAAVRLRASKFSIQFECARGSDHALLVNHRHSRWG